MNNRDVYNTEFGILVMSGLLITDGSQHKGLGPIAQENDFIFSLAEAINYDTRTNSKIKYIIILGDVAYGARSKEYQVATDIIAELCEELNVARENVIIVPGNHDINRVDSEISCALKNLDEKELIEHQGTKFEKFTAFYNSFYDGFTTVESFNPEKAIFRTVLDKEMNSVFLGINTNFKESQIDHAGMIPYDRLSEELRIIRREYPNENFIALMHHGPSFGKLNNSIENGESLLRLFKANGVNTFIFSKAKNLVGISTSDNTYYLRCGSVYSTIISIPTNMMLLENKKNGKENALFVNYYEYVSQGKYWKVQSMGTGESGRIVLEPRMRDQEIYYLLKKIDDGYDATEYETSMLKSVKSIAWNNIDTLPNCINLLTAVTELDLRNSNVSDIGALSGMEALTCLILKRTEVSDISVLQGLKALTTLNLNETRVSDISALRGLKELTELYIGGTRITDIRTISRLTALRSLSLSGAKVSDISALEGLEKLTALNIRETKVSDISSLSGLKSLTYLNLIGTNVSDISALRGLHALSSLYLRKTNVSDISALKELKELKELDLRYLNLDAIPEWILDLQLDFR